MSHPIPDAVLTQHLAVLGKTGSGKSYLTRSIVERLLDAGRRVCIVDYTGVWYGLRSSANGRKGAYPIVIFGGEHGDVPLNELAGPAVAKLVAGGNRPSIIDMDGLTIGAQQRFVTAFLEELLPAQHPAAAPRDGGDRRVRAADRGTWHGAHAGGGRPHLPAGAQEGLQGNRHHAAAGERAQARAGPVQRAGHPAAGGAAGPQGGGRLDQGPRR